MEQHLRSDLEVDVSVENHGSIFFIQPLTPAGRAWVDEHVVLESWQWQGGGFAVEYRFAEDIVDGMLADGLAVA